MTFMIAWHCNEFWQSATIMKRRAPCNFAMIAAAALALLGCDAVAQETCKLTAIGSAQVAAVRDGRTLMLDDGRELRLAAIEAGDDGRHALELLVDGRPLRLERLAAESDRYGRLVAFAFAGDAQQSLQQALLAEGQARVSARIGDKACADGLLTIERAARAARRGLWADPNFAPLRAENIAQLQAERGHFALVEGKVLSVRESGAIIYMSTSGGAGRAISPSPFCGASSGPLPRQGSNPSNLKAAASACAAGSNSAAARSSPPRPPNRSSSQSRA